MSDLLAIERAVDDAAFVAREFRVSAELRRCCSYIAIGGWLCLALTALLPRPNVQPVDPAGVAVGIFLAGIAPALLWLVATTYQLRLDERGLARRRFWWWTLWSWEDFIAGKITISADSKVLTFRERPLWDRWLLPGFLPSQDSAFLIETLRRVVPDDCVLNGPLAKLAAEPTEVFLDLTFSRRMRIDRAGCELLGSSGQTIAWDDITELRLERTHYDTYDIYRLTIVPRSGKEITGCLNLVSIGEVSFSPRTAGGDAWVKHLQSFVPANRWQYFRMRGTLNSRGEGEYRLKKFEAMLRAMRWFQFFGWAILPLTGWIFVPKIVALWNVPFLGLGWKLVALACMLLVLAQPTVLLVALAAYNRRKFAKQIHETQQQMAELADD